MRHHIIPKDWTVEGIRSGRESGEPAGTTSVLEYTDAGEIGVSGLLGRNTVDCASTTGVTDIPGSWFCSAPEDSISGDVWAS
jgi:hypothetical protein